MGTYYKRYSDTRTATPPVGGISPVQVCKAYGFLSLKSVRSVKIGIVSLGGCFSQSDTDSAFLEYGLPVPSVTPVGTQTPMDHLGTEENMLDIQCLGTSFAYSTGQPARILEQFSERSMDGLVSAINALVDAKCEVISISWGWPASQQTIATRQARTAACARAADANCHIFAASGDESLDDNTTTPTPDDPCCDPNVWGVGGTCLTLDDAGNRVSECAWGDGKSADEGGGGGFDKDIAMPDYQLGVVPGTCRGCPDSSAHADPGYSLYALGKWMLMGGTSASAPLTAGYVAAILSTLPGPISHSNMCSLLYGKRTTAFNDITLGSNGDPATPGWDPATGCGSINGAGMASALTGN